MRYSRIIAAVESEIWAIQPEKLGAILEFLYSQDEGIKFSAEEIEARIAPQTAAAVARREGAVAVLPLRGVISNRINMLSAISGGTTIEGFTRSFNAVMNDDGVKAVIMDVDSPGGPVHGGEELAALIMAARGRKPIVAHVNATAASLAYWIACAADEIVVTPSGWVGSIGAMGGHEDISEKLAKEGIKRTLVTSSEFKNEAPPHLPLSDEARAHMESLVAAYDKMFVDRIAAARKVSPAKIRSEFGRGRMVLAADALAAGMIDRIATLEETLARFGVGAASSSATTKAFAPARERRALDLT